jgi:biotin operon repressor
MPDIPSYADGGAGHRGVDTSIAAAKVINDSLPRLQKAVFAVIRQAGSRGATGDEIAQALGWERWRVRPRTSELRRDGRIVDSGARRESLSGIASIVWVAPSQIGGPDNA